MRAGPNRTENAGHVGSIGGRLRLALASGLAALAASAFAASAASADVITFDHGYVKISGVVGPIEIVTPADPLEINNVTYGPGNSFATAAAADFDFALFSGKVGSTPFTVDVAALAPVTGSFDPATGVMTTGLIDYSAAVVVGPSINETCSYATVSLAFSSESTDVFFGDRFDAAPAPPANGAIVGAWTGEPNHQAEGCPQLNGLTSGPGAFWFSNGIAKPTLVPVAGQCKKSKKPNKSKKPKCGCKKKAHTGKKGKKGKCAKKKRKAKKR